MGCSTSRTRPSRSRCHRARNGLGTAFRQMTFSQRRRPRSGRARRSKTALARTYRWGRGRSGRRSRHTSGPPHRHSQDDLEIMRRAEHRKVRGVYRRAQRRVGSLSTQHKHAVHPVLQPASDLHRRRDPSGTTKPLNARLPGLRCLRRARQGSSAARLLAAVSAPRQMPGSRLRLSIARVYAVRRRSNRGVVT